MSEERGYLNTGRSPECMGCEACVQSCPTQAVRMKEDKEGFSYPTVDEKLCIHCGLCNKACPYEHMPERYQDNKLAYGGYIRDDEIRSRSTSGGAFSAVTDAWCDHNYVIFGAAADGLEVYHTYITDKRELDRFRKSKYSQSRIGSAYTDARDFLLQGKKVLFSGTPCQIAGLKAYLGDTEQSRLLTVEVVCEGVPSPWYMRKYNEWCRSKYGSAIESLDYRFKDRNKWDFEPMETILVKDREKQKRKQKRRQRKIERKNRGKWDFQVMLTKLRGGQSMKVDRWFNPFWSIWLEHLMSRPSCYECPFATTERVADLTLGDLWGVHIYCPELYGKNGGASLIICNTEKGKRILHLAEKQMFGHVLDFDTALKYQSPMRRTIDKNPGRKEFMEDLTGSMDYRAINRKWAKRPTVKLLWQKYIWGNRQKVALWSLKHRMKH